MKTRPAPSVASEGPSDAGPVEAPELEPQPRGNAASITTLASSPPPSDGDLPFIDELEAAFGQDLGWIPVRLGDPSLAEVGAEGTAGADGVAFASPSPDLETVAEEVAHYLQRQIGATDAKALGHHTDPPEREAKHVAAEVAAGRPAPTLTQASTAALQRRGDTENAPDPQADAERIRTGLRRRNEDDINRVLGQAPGHVRAVQAVYDGDGGSMVEDLRRAYVVPEAWAFVCMLLDRAGIAVPRVETARGGEEGVEQMSIRADPAVALAVPGTRMTFTLNRPPMIRDSRSTTSVQWICVNDPRSVDRDGAPQTVYGPTDGPWEAQWAFAGTHTVYARVQDHHYGQEPSEPIWLEHQQQVVSLDERTQTELDQVQPQDWVATRAGLELQRLNMSQGAMRDQAVGDGPHITVSGANPAVPGIAPNLASNTYTITGSQAANHRWYVIPEDPRLMPTQSFYGLQSTTFEGRFAYGMGQGDTGRLPIAQSNKYHIVCEGIDAAGTSMGVVARYQQVVLTSDEAEQLQALDTEIGLIDDAVEAVDPATRTTARAVYINQETGQSVALSLFVGRRASGDGVLLIDATPGVRRKEYGGSNVSEAISAFASDNSYPTGQISLSVPDGVSGSGVTYSITFQTDGASSWSEWASATGWLSLGLFVAGAVAVVIPGGQVAAPFLFAAGAAAGAASGGLSIYDELQNAQPSAGRIAIDVLGIASSILGGGAAIRAVKQGAGVALSGTAGRFFVYGALTADIGSAVLLTAEGIDQISAILDDPNLRESDKIGAIVRILGMLALSGGLIALGARDVNAVQTRLSRHLSAEVVGALDDRALLMLGQLDDATLAGLAGAPTERLTRVASLVDHGRQVRVEGGNVVLDGGERIALSQLDSMSEEAFAALRRGAPGSAVGPGAIRPAQGTPELDQWLREGIPGQVRPETLLSNADVADVLNRQLQNVTPDEIDAIIRSFPADQQALARRLLARGSGFGNMESLGRVYEAILGHAGRPLFVPGSGSMADNIAYMSTKGLFSTGGGRLPTTNVLDRGAIVILDDVVMHYMSDPAFAQELIAQGCVLIHPRGLTTGVNLFNAASPDAIRGQLDTLVQQGGGGAGGNLDEAARTALDADVLRQLDAMDPRLRQQLQVVDPAAATPDTSAAISNQLNGTTGITADQVEDVLDQLPERFRALARELIVQQTQVMSPRSFAQSLLDHHNTLEGLAGGRDMYFFIPESGKSYGMMAMAHQQITGTSVGRYVNGTAELAGAGLGPDAVLVILDDVAGSGSSLDMAFRDAAMHFRGDVIVAPMVSTDRAAALFGSTAPGGLGNYGNLTFAPQRQITQLESSPFFSQLPPDQQQMLRELVGNTGYDGNGLSMAFPYMAPDNNNAFFGDQLAPYFITNNTRGASKSGPYAPPPQ